ncbi:hypothetical protein M405DRAFT_813955 [Rhizopogon salebrosus TDB-379]|nr:hypothetical protein M405DRAFT_813955 [Rhizopogon salebrosus TDB-379]
MCFYYASSRDSLYDARPVPATTLQTIAMYESQRRPSSAPMPFSNPNPVGRDRSQMGDLLHNFGAGADRSTGRQFNRDRCERALMVLEVATEN